MSDTRTLPADPAREAIAAQHLAERERIMEDMMLREYERLTGHIYSEGFKQEFDRFGDTTKLLRQLGLLSVAAAERLVSMYKVAFLVQVFELERFGYKMTIELAKKIIRHVLQIAEDPVAFEFDARWLVVVRAVKKVEDWHRILPGPPEIDAFLKNQTLLKPFYDARAQTERKRLSERGPKILCS